MKTRIYKIILLFLVLTAASAGAMDVQILQSSDSQLIVEVRFDSIAVHRYVQDGVWYSDVTMPNAGALLEPGKPRLPMTGLMLGIPADSHPTMTILNETTDTRDVGSIALLEEAEHPADAAASGWYPAKAAEIGVDGLIRQQRVLQVSLFPVRYLADKQIAQITRSITLKIDFGAAAAASPATLPDGFESAYSSLLTNYQQSKAWRTAAQIPQPLRKSSALPSTVVKLYVKTDGVYAVTGKELADAGIDLTTIDPQTCALNHKGQPVAIVVEGQADGIFDYQDRVVFIGKHNRGDDTYLSFFSDNNVYQLTWGGGPSLRFSPFLVTPSGDPGSALDLARLTLHFEKDMLYERMVGYAGEQDDHWFWEKLSNEEDYTFPVDLPGLVPEGQLTFKAAFHGLTESRNVKLNHHLLALINDQAIGETWGTNNNPFKFDAPSFQLANTAAPLRLKFHLPLDMPGVFADHVFLNWFEFSYDRRLSAQAGELVFDVELNMEGVRRVRGFANEQVYFLTENGYRLTDYSSRRTSEGAELLLSLSSLLPTRVYAVDAQGLCSVSRLEIDAPSDLKNPSNRADYLVITHRNFQQTAQRLADYRESTGLRTLVVDVQDIYDEFNGGIYDPRSIKQFIKYAFESWSRPAPMYVLLFGDTTYLMDKDAAAESDFTSFMPSYMVNTLSFGMTSSDNYFGAVSGDDDLPDLYVGRLPANTADEAGAMVDKIIAYETRQPAAEWRRHITLAAGNGDFFGMAAQYLADHHLPRWMVVNQLSTDFTSPFFHTTEELISWINQGQSIINFLVHGAGEQIDDAKLFEKDDLLRLNNVDKYGFSVTMSCYIGHFDNPERASLGEALLAIPNKGIMALFGSAGKSYRYADFYFNNALFDGIFRQKRRTLGEITTFAKYDLIAQTRGFFEPVRNFLLLGDPAATLKLPQTEMPLTLSKTVLVEGDHLRVSGKTPGAGTLILTATSGADSVLAEQQIEVSNGKFDVDLLNMTPQLRKKWGGSGGYGRVRAFFSNSEASAVGAQSFSVIRPLLKRFTHLPVSPVGFEPVNFIVEVDPTVVAESGGLQSLTVQWKAGSDLWSDLLMSFGSDGLWKTTSPLSLEEGTTVIYKLLVKNSAGVTTETDASEFAVLYNPDLYTDAPVKWSSAARDLLMFTIKNRGGSDARNIPVKIMNLTRNQPLVERFIVPLVRSRADTTVFIPVPPLSAGSYDLEIVIDPDNSIHEEEESNNRLLKTMNLVTVAEGSNGVLRFFDNDVTLTLPEKSVPQTFSLEVSSIILPDLSKAALASSLTPLKTLTSAQSQLYRLELADSTATTLAPIKVTMGYDPEDSLTALWVSSQGLRLYAWEPRMKLWKGLATTHVAIAGRIAATLPAGLTVFALMASSDHEAPKVSIDVEGQHFADGDVTPVRPTFLISMEDNSGIDVSSEALKLKLDGVEVPPSDYALSFDSQNPRVARLSFMPDVNRSEHELSVAVTDLNANSASRTVRFRIAEKFDVQFVANHPNPFVTETTLAFLIDDLASKVKLDIYTVSGRHVRSFEFTDITGYHEVDWDGADQQGDPVANGVYYLKFVAVKENQRIERIEKLAKLE